MDASSPQARALVQTPAISEVAVFGGAQPLNQRRHPGGLTSAQSGGARRYPCDQTFGGLGVRGNLVKVDERGAHPKHQERHGGKQHVPGVLHAFKPDQTCRDPDTEEHRQHHSVKDARHENAGQCGCAADPVTPVQDVRPHDFTGPEGQHVIHTKTNGQNGKQLVRGNRFDRPQEVVPAYGSEVEPGEVDT